MQPRAESEQVKRGMKRTGDIVERKRRKLYLF